MPFNRNRHHNTNSLKNKELNIIRSIESSIYSDNIEAVMQKYPGLPANTDRNKLFKFALTSLANQSARYLYNNLKLPEGPNITVVANPINPQLAFIVLKECKFEKIQECHSLINELNGGEIFIEAELPIIKKGLIKRFINPEKVEANRERISSLFNHIESGYFNIDNVIEAIEETYKNKEHLRHLVVSPFREFKLNKLLYE
jgi:hypothetical protein